jgi:hypothetical protein
MNAYSYFLPAPGRGEENVGQAPSPVQDSRGRLSNIFKASPKEIHEMVGLSR